MSDKAQASVINQPAQVDVRDIGLPVPTEEEMKAVLEMVELVKQKLGNSIGAQCGFFSHPDIGMMAVKWMAEIINQCLAQTIYADRLNFMCALNEAAKQQTIRNQLIPNSIQLHVPTVSAIIRGGQNIIKVVPIPQLDLTSGRRDEQTPPPETVQEPERPKSNILIP